MEERRKYRRLDLEGELFMNPIVAEGEDKEPVPISVFNCSRGGIGFRAQCQLVIGDNYEANLIIWTKEVIHVFLKIVRGMMLEDSYEYGAIFIGMPEFDRQRISVYETVQDTIAEMGEEDA